MLVSRVFQSCPPGVLHGEPGIPGLLLFIIGEPLGFTTVVEKMGKYRKKLVIVQGALMGYHKGSTGHAHTTIRLWIVEHTNGNGRTWVGTMVHRRRGGRGATGVAARTARRHTAIPSLPRRSATPFLTQWVPPLESRLPHHHHVALDALLRTVRRRPADRRVMHRSGAVPISVRRVPSSGRRRGGTRNGIRLLLGGGHRGVATRGTVIWGAPHRRGHCGGRAALVVPGAAVRPEAARRKVIRENPFHLNLKTHLKACRLGVSGEPSEICP